MIIFIIAPMSQSCFSWYANRSFGVHRLYLEIKRRSPALAGMPIGAADLRNSLAFFVAVLL